MNEIQETAAQIKERNRKLRSISDSHKLTEVQGLELMKDDLLDFTIDMQISSISDLLTNEMDDTDIEIIKFWSELTHSIWLASELDELTTIFKEKCSGIEFTEEIDMLVSWLIGMFVKGRRDNNE